MKWKHFFMQIYFDLAGHANAFTLNFQSALILRTQLARVPALIGGLLIFNYRRFHVAREAGIKNKQSAEKDSAQLKRRLCTRWVWCGMYGRAGRRANERSLRGAEKRSPSGISIRLTEAQQPPVKIYGNGTTFRAVCRSFHLQNACHRINYAEFHAYQSRKLSH